jgi:hypothetical protein
MSEVALGKLFIRVFKLSVHLKRQKINEISSHYMFSIIVGFSNGFQAILSVQDEITLQKTKQLCQKLNLQLHDSN